jgi:hypothetical protein
MRLFLIRLGIAATMLTGLAGNAFSDPITWKFTSPNGDASMANARSFMTNAITVSATAWSYSQGSHNTAFEKATLGLSNTGLGVCDQPDPRRCNGGIQGVDNFGPHEWILFVFSQPVDLISVNLDPSRTSDTDISYWAGNVGSSLDLAGKSYAELASLGFGGQQDALGSYPKNSVDIPIASLSVNALLVGGRRGRFFRPDTDRFSIGSLTGSVPMATPMPAPVPEPGTILLLGSGLTLLMLRASGLVSCRRRRQGVKTPYTDRAIAARFPLAVGGKQLFRDHIQQ